MATLLGPDRFAITSSGIASTRNKAVKTSTVYTRALARAHKLTHQINTQKTQTTDKLLAAADVIVFMNKDVYNDALHEYQFDTRKCLVWDVADINPKVDRAAKAKNTEKAWRDASEGTFRQIAVHCDALKDYLTKTAWVDVMDEHNEHTGLRLPVAWVTDRGLWHRGVHVVVQTADGRFVVGKRSNGIVFAPGMLDISLGGGMDCGEAPLETAVRETREELGVPVAEKHFRPLFMCRWNTFHPRYNKHTRGHVYVYTVKLPQHSRHFTPQPGEVAELRLLTRGQVKRLLRTHRIRNFGRLKWGDRIYRRAIAASLHT